MELPLHVVSETLDVAAIAEDVGEPEEPVPEQTWNFSSTEFLRPSMSLRSQKDVIEVEDHVPGASLVALPFRDFSSIEILRPSMSPRSQKTLLNPKITSRSNPGSTSSPRAGATPVELLLHKVTEPPTLRDKSCKM